MPVRERDLKRSREYWERAQRVIPSGTQTLSKGPDQFVRGVYPIYLERGSGSHVYDVDGNEYIDCPMSLGPIILGHAYPATVDAGTQQFQKGITFSHTQQDVDDTMEACGESLLVVKRALEEGDFDKYMEGERAGVVFRPAPQTA